MIRRAASCLLMIALARAVTAEDYCVIGAGAAGIQMGYFLQKAGRSYTIYERGEGPANFFTKFPIHRQLISINKRHTGRGGSSLALEHNMRHDWHSLLTGLHSGEVDEERLFGKITNKFYPKADSLVQYLREWAAAYDINIQANTEITKLKQKPGSDDFTVEMKLTNSSSGQEPVTDTVRCKWVLAATGLFKNHIPNIPGLAEHSIAYNDQPNDRESYTNKTVAIIGGGNAGFETFNAAMEEAAYVHIHSRSPVKMSWETHYVGNLRAINMLPIDNYQLKSQDVMHMPSPVGLTAETTVVTKELIDGEEKICMSDRNHASMVKGIEDGTSPQLGRRFGGHSLTFEERLLNVDRYCYDMIIRCTGFEIDTSIFDLPEPLATEGGREGRKYASLTHEYQSPSAKNLYFAGTLAHVLDFKKSSGGFVHGFRYTVRALHKMLEQKNHGVEWPRTEVAMSTQSVGSSWFGDGGKQTLLQKLVDRMDTSAGLYQMFGTFTDVVLIPREAGKDTALYLEEVPMAYIPELVGNYEYLTMSMEYGPEFHGHERVLRSERVFHDFDPERAHKSQFLHPVIRYFVPGMSRPLNTPGAQATAQHHVLEDTYTNFTNPTLHVHPLEAFLQRFEGKKLTAADPAIDLSWDAVSGQKTAKVPTRAPARKGTKARAGNIAAGWDMSADAPIDLESMKAGELKAMLKARGLDPKGTRKQLVERVQAALAQGKCKAGDETCDAASV